jgi:hypothetical protein
MPRSIVCGVDDSEAAEAVADTARWLANRLGTPLVWLHASAEQGREPEAAASARIRLGLGERDDVCVLEGPPADGLLESGAEAEGRAE